MNYNMQTIKKRVAPLFENPNKSCHYFASIGITNLNLTTYNEFIHDQAKICFKILNDFETSRKITYAVFAGNSVGLLRAGRNLPWADDYDIILFNHDIAFFSIGSDKTASQAGKTTVGMYHIAWEVKTLVDLEDVRVKLQAAGALVGQSDHGVNKSLYAQDPDGLEFEVMWLVPAAEWGIAESMAIVEPLDLAIERKKFEALGYK